MSKQQYESGTFSKRSEEKPDAPEVTKVRHDFALHFGAFVMLFCPSQNVISFLE